MELYQIVAKEAGKRIGIAATQLSTLTLSIIPPIFIYCVSSHFNAPQDMTFNLMLASAIVSGPSAYSIGISLIEKLEEI